LFINNLYKKVSFFFEKPKVLKKCLESDSFLVISTKSGKILIYGATKGRKAESNKETASQNNICHY